MHLDVTALTRAENVAERSFGLGPLEVYLPPRFEGGSPAGAPRAGPVPLTPITVRVIASDTRHLRPFFEGLPLPGSVLGLASCSARLCRLRRDADELRRTLR